MYPKRGWIDLVADGLSELPAMEGSYGMQMQPWLVTCMTFPCLVPE